MILGTISGSPNRGSSSDPRYNIWRPARGFIISEEGYSCFIFIYQGLYCGFVGPIVHSSFYIFMLIVISLRLIFYLRVADAPTILSEAAL